MKKMILNGFVVLTSLLMTTNAFSQAFTENFDDITTLTTGGWIQQNNSSPVGTNPVWFQGNPPSNSGPFAAFNGADNAYIACNFNSTSGGTGTISNWLVAPNRTLRNGDVFTFYTRKPTIGGGQIDYPDRLEVRLSTNGASTNVGAGATGIGDFTTLLLSVNPTLVANVYPQTWTQYTVTISGLPAPTSGRIAFRYFVTAAGPAGTNSDYIGIDNVVYTPYVCPTITMTAGGALSGGIAGTAYSSTLTQTGALGAPNFAVTAGALPPGLTLSSNGTISGTPTATGTFNFTITVNDASGCTGTQSYSITTVCPANPITFTAPTLCENEPIYTLVEATPAGGTYSGTGVTAGQFDPTVGTQTITYDYTDAYGCSHNQTATVTVNELPDVTLAAIPPVCTSTSEVILDGGLPTGGNYTGIGVTGTTFETSSGTQTITYTYTDVNSCTSAASQILTVNELPTVTLDAFTAVCANDNDVTLTGGLPVGGTYSGSGVTANNFDPSNGTQEITYTYTDVNGCTSDATQSLVVNTNPTASLNLATTEVCTYSNPITLTGGQPAGGVYTGNGVTSSTFTPSSALIGNQIITYTVTENGCEGSATATITVDACASIEGTALNSFKVYPNPTTGELKIELTDNSIQNALFEIVNIDGKVMLTQEIKNSTQVNTISLVHLAKGTYLLQVKDGDRTQVQRIVLN